MSRFGQLYFSLTGRTSRRDFWLLWMLPALVLVVAHAFLFGAYVSRDQAQLMLLVLLLWPSIAVGVKRWHDIDASGWWVLVNLVPYVGWLVALLFNGFGRGTIGDNRYGRDPLMEHSDP